MKRFYTLLMMRHGFICASANIDDLDPAVGDAPIVMKRIDDANVGIAPLQQLWLWRDKRGPGLSAW